jgi:membrane protease YdiL (CAAX protease family)
MKRQAELIQTMSDKEVLVHLYITQLLLLFLSFIIGLFFFDWESFGQLWQFSFHDVIVYGAGSALIVLIVDFALMHYLPEDWYDDGGVNEKIFQTRSIPHIFFLCLLIAFSEEILFRGVIQTNFGLVFASIIFALLHVRYLSKIFLFIVVVLLSFFLGYVYELTHSLWVTIFSHFLIDFVLAVKIRFDYLQSKRKEEY